MTRAQALKIRRKGERTVSFTVHAEFCLYSNGTIVPPYPCTCGSRKRGYTNVWS